jgi:hypothetical protein
MKNRTITSYVLISLTLSSVASLDGSLARKEGAKAPEQTTSSFHWNYIVTSVAVSVAALLVLSVALVLGIKSRVTGFVVEHRYPRIAKCLKCCPCCKRFVYEEVLA